jgi:hypothetical protein
LMSILSEFSFPCFSYIPKRSIKEVKLDAFVKKDEN